MAISNPNEELQNNQNDEDYESDLALALKLSEELTQKIQEDNNGSVKSVEPIEPLKPSEPSKQTQTTQEQEQAQKQAQEKAQEQIKKNMTEILQHPYFVEKLYDSDILEFVKQCNQRQNFPLVRSCKDLPSNDWHYSPYFFSLSEVQGCLDLNYLFFIYPTDKSLEIALNNWNAVPFEVGNMSALFKFDSTGIQVYNYKSSHPIGKATLEPHVHHKTMEAFINNEVNNIINEIRDEIKVNSSYSRFNPSAIGVVSFYELIRDKVGFIEQAKKKTRWHHQEDFRSITAGAQKFQNIETSDPDEQLRLIMELSQREMEAKKASELQAKLQGESLIQALTKEIHDHPCYHKEISEKTLISYSLSDEAPYKFNHLANSKRFQWNGKPFIITEATDHPNCYKLCFFYYVFNKKSLGSRKFKFDSVLFKPTAKGMTLLDPKSLSGPSQISERDLYPQLTQLIEHSSQHYFHPLIQKSENLKEDADLCIISLTYLIEHKMYLKSYEELKYKDSLRDDLKQKSKFLTPPSVLTLPVKDGTVQLSGVDTGNFGSYSNAGNAIPPQAQPPKLSDPDFMTEEQQLEMATQLSLESQPKESHAKKSGPPNANEQKTRSDIPDPASTLIFTEDPKETRTRILRNRLQNLEQDSQALRKITEIMSNDHAKTKEQSEKQLKLKSDLDNKMAALLKEQESNSLDEKLEKEIIDLNSKVELLNKTIRDLEVKEKEELRLLNINQQTISRQFSEITSMNTELKQLTQKPDQNSQQLPKPTQLK